MAHLIHQFYLYARQYLTSSNRNSFLRTVIHVWPDQYAKMILKELRSSVSNFTKLILYNFLVPYAAPSNNLFIEIPSSEVTAAPWPLLVTYEDLAKISGETSLKM